MSIVFLPSLVEFKATYEKPRLGKTIGNTAKTNPAKQVDATTILAAKIAFESLYLNGRNIATNLSIFTATRLEIEMNKDSTEKIHKLMYRYSERYLQRGPLPQQQPVA